MTEAALVRAIRKKIAARWPDFIVWKLSDRYTRGLPDLLVIGKTKKGTALCAALEAKRPKGRVRPMQAETQRRFFNLGCWTAQYLVVRSVSEAAEILKQMENSR